MQKLFNYLRYIPIFIIFELLITFITSLLNLIGLNSGITQIIILISNIILFFILNYLNALRKKKRGLLEGVILGLIFIILMIIIKLSLFNNSLSVTTIIYYTILIIVSLIGGMFGVNKKSKN